MKLLLDQGLPRGASLELRRLGLDVVHTGEVGMATATDLDILERARIEGRTVITLDADFHALLAHSNAASPSVVRVRIEGLAGVQLAELVDRVVRLCDADLRSGAAVSVDAHGVRVRSLPLLP